MDCVTEISLPRPNTVTQNKLSRHIDELLRLRPDAAGEGAAGDESQYLAHPHHYTDRAGAALYGGLLLGQATGAAQAHAQQCFGDQMRLHSLHAYFLRRAGVSDDIRYNVKSLRRGRSFGVCGGFAQQNERELFDFSASFHTGERGFDHQLQMPDVDRPDDARAVSPMETDLRGLEMGRGSRPVRFSMPLPVWIDPGSSRAFVRDGQTHLYCWMRALEPIKDNHNAQVSALAYLSDYCTMATVVYTHDSERNTNLFVVSLDHSMWVYNTPHVDQWHLYAMTSPISTSGRGLSIGHVFGSDGQLWASFAQEGLLRISDGAAPGVLA